MATIPLHCNICPKKPNFSDVSHLLTHIASKGHLSNYYKVKVRSSTEDASRRLIEAYDQWYAEWSVEELMSERMNQKDKRRTRARPSVTPVSVARANPSAPPDIQAPTPQPAARSEAVGTLLDPRLSEHQLVKVERSCTTTPTPTPQPGPVLCHRPFAPRVQGWATASRSTSTSNHTNPDYETSSEYSDQSMPLTRSQHAAEDTCAIEEDAADPPGVEDTMAVSEASKLKGVLWPGMNLFDAATPEMRRKRNQKKDSSVVEQLEINSLEVEATELIFTPQGSFKRKRRISSSECDFEEMSSPLRRESPKPSRTRPVLASLDVNSGRRPRQVVRPPAPALPCPKRSHGTRARPAHGHGERSSRGKRNFSVYVDEEDSFGQPAPMNYLTTGYHRPSPTSAPQWPSLKPYNDIYPYDTSNKENALSAYPQGGSDHHHPHAVGYHYHAYSYGLGHEQHAFQYRDHLYLNNAYRQQHHEDADDQRTVTAPPSPSTG
ncbi:uncharacterized protein EI97DRAFT_471648 [Westerdykella ornata]|uniref:Uncharacterized protein n=1 Tax=Westerdykella ornata TaxID=318751 RepID=A0A6A6K036_WESOR|nr:uncharacterized protein EI97DRAFT_471648 [Westerdykella ornata]KAF2280699.1 hypothetical protein EI97DRAFT_471648 [Westerdykella ornata]